jgi:hypothetical protein
MSWIDELNEDMAKRRETQKAIPHTEKIAKTKKYVVDLIPKVLGKEGLSDRANNIVKTLGPDGCRNRALTRETNMKKTGMRKQASLSRSKTLGKNELHKIALKTGDTKKKISEDQSNKILNELPEIFTKQMFIDLCNKFNFKKSLFETARDFRKKFKIHKNGNQFLGPTTYCKL